MILIGDIMKRLISLFIIACSFLAGSHVVMANTINSINMDIYVDENGDAIVKEIWDYSSQKNTEIYHAYPNMGNASITDFNVSDSTGKPYKMVDWDVDAGFDAKAYKYGYNYTNGGVELCLGISHYGNYKYYLQYKIHGFVANVSDAQIIYWTLLQKSSESLKDYYIKIYSDTPYSDSLPVWGYGIKGAYAYVYNGEIELTTDRAVKSDEYVTVLVKFPSGTFKTNHTINKSFDEVFKMAEKGKSLYRDNSETIINIFSIIAYLGIFIGPVIAVIKAGRKSKKKLQVKVLPPKDVPIFRDLPFNDDIFKAFFIANEYDLLKNNTDFLGSLLLKWIRDDYVSVSGEKKDTTIIFHKAPVDLDFSFEPEKSMYTMMYTASKDGVLEQKEFKNYCSHNYDRVLSWFDKVIDAEFNIIKENDINVISTDQRGLSRKLKYEATPELNEKAAQMAGLKKFFKEFGSIKDKSAIEVKLWREYLMYAQIFGVAEKVAKDFKELYPNVIQTEDLSTVIYINHFYTTGVNAASSARSRAESYSSGGGGFSSGGGGGGSFGGGGSMGSR